MLLEDDYKDYHIEGYAQEDYVPDKKDEEVTYTEIHDYEIVETCREFSYSKAFLKKVQNFIYF